MAVSQQTLQSISNPTGGGLSRAYSLYLQGQQNRRAQEAHENQKIAAQYEQMDFATKATGGYSKAMLNWIEQNPDAMPEEVEAKQTELRNLMPKHVQQYIPEGIQSTAELQRGYDNAMQVQRMLYPTKYRERPFDPITLSDGKATGVFDANTEQGKIREFLKKNPNAREVAIPKEKSFDAITLSDGEVTRTFDANTQQGEIQDFLKSHPAAQEVYPQGRGTSEFERLHSIPEELRTQAQQKRLDVLSGLGMRLGQELSLDQRKHQFRVNSEANWRDELNEGIKHFKDMDKTITEAVLAIKASDMKLSETLLAQAMSQLYESDVRAYQMYQQFDEAYGNVLERYYENIRRWATGVRSDEEKAEIEQAMLYIRDQYVKPGKQRVQDLYRTQAKMDDLRPYQVAPPESPGDIVNKEFADRTEQADLIQVYFPQYARMSADEIANADLPETTKINMLRALFPDRFD